jgi:broad specificity phosphatase PhoE
MQVFIVPVGATIYSRKGRAHGWRHYNIDREGMKQVKDMARTLRERGIQKVFCSDLHTQTGFAIGRELRVPTVTERNWRHFNVGRHAGKYRDEVENILETVSEKWAADKTIPIAGGDSWLSYTKRLNRALTSLLKSGLPSVALVLDVRGIQTFKEMVTAGANASPSKSLLEKNGTINPDKVLSVKLTTAA